MAAAAAGAQKESTELFEKRLLTLSQFLRAAASKRQEPDEMLEENRAFEGVLLLIYGGDNGAVEAMKKLIEGSEETVPTVEGTMTSYTCTPSWTKYPLHCLTTV